MKNICSIIIVLFFITFGIENNLFAQKVGVVLSGGGAKGMAHVGVLRALEENDIPIDYITGTSIGAIVGALYASGYTPDEIEELMTSQQMKTWSEGIIEEKYRFYYTKDDDNAEITALKFRADSVTKTYLPANVIEPFQMDFAFMQIFAAPAAAAGYDFDSLMIPFRCVASDVFLHKPVYFNSGNLAAAVRASMTFPLYFKPIRINNRLMFDGGIYDNFPKNIMIDDFNPNVIIGVKVSSNSEEPEEDDLLLQLENMIAEQTDFSLPEGKSVLIEPIIKNLGLTDLENGSQVARIGYDSAMSKMVDIKHLVRIRTDSVQRNRKRAEFKAKIPQLLFNNIEIKGLRNRQERYIVKLLSRKREIIGIDKLKEQYFKVLAGDFFSSLYPEAVFDTSLNVFDLNLFAKKTKKFRAGFGGNISSSILNQAYIGLSYKYFFARAYKFSGNVYFGKFYTSAQGKARVDFATRLPWFGETSFTFNRFNYSISSPEYFYEDKKLPFVIFNEFQYRAELGFPVGVNGKFNGGFVLSAFAADYFQSKKFFSYDSPDESNFNFSRSFISYTESTLNRMMYADRGIFLKTAFSYYSGKENHAPGSTALNKTASITHFEYLDFELDYTNIFQFSKRIAAGYRFQAVWSNQPFFSNYTATVIMAKPFHPFPYAQSLFAEDFRAQSFAAGGILLIYRITDDFHFRVEPFIFQPVNDLQSVQTSDLRFVAEKGKYFQNRFACGSTSLVYHSIAGPISMSYNYFRNNGQDNFYLIFNLGFFVFNKNSHQ